MEVLLREDLIDNQRISGPWNATDHKNEDGFFCLDESWTIVYLNKMAEIIFGIKSVDTLNKNFWTVFKDTVPTIIVAAYSNKPLEDIPRFSSHYWPERGGWIVISTYYYDKSFSISVRISNLIVEEQPGEKKLIVVNELYKFVTEITNNCLWDWNIISGEIFWIDSGHKRLFGYDIENCLLPQVFWESRIHPEDKPHVISEIHKCVAQNFTQTLDYEYRFRKANNEYAYLLDHARIIRDENNLAYRIIGTSHDITDKKLAEIKLVATENKLSMIVEQTINGIIITGSKEEIIYINKALLLLRVILRMTCWGKSLANFYRVRILICRLFDTLSR